jgi:hypothetical protein
MTLDIKVPQLSNKKENKMQQSLMNKSVFFTILFVLSFLNLFSQVVIKNILCNSENGGSYFLNINFNGIHDVRVGKEVYKKPVFGQSFVFHQYFINKIDKRRFGKKGEKDLKIAIEERSHYFEGWKEQLLKENFKLEIEGDSIIINIDTSFFPGKRAGVFKSIRRMGKEYCVYLYLTVAVKYKEEKDILISKEDIEFLKWVINHLNIELLN